ALNDRKMYPLLLAWSQKHFLDDQMRFLLDVRQGQSREHLVTNYLASGAPSGLNLADTLMREIRQVAALPQNSENNKRMAKLLADAYKEQVGFLTPTFATGGQSFDQFEPYLQTLGQTSTDPKVTVALRTLRLTGDKAKQFNGFMSVYLHD